jgi:hypothetical protein
MTTADDETAAAVLDERATPTSRARRSSPRSTTARRGWLASPARWPTPNVNIYGHLFLGRWGDRATFTFVVDDPETARPILERKD